MKTQILVLVLLFICGSFCTEVSASPPCELCHLFFNTIQKSVPERPLLPLLEQIAVLYCVKKHLQDKNVCQGAIKEMTKYILTGLWRRHTNPHIICQDIFMCSK